MNEVPAKLQYKIIFVPTSTHQLGVGVKTNL